MPTLAPNLWFSHDAEEAAFFYVSLLPDSRIDGVTTLPADSPSGPADSAKIVEFTLMGRPFTAFSTVKPFETFNHAISLVVACDDQSEIDRIWAALSEGGKTEQCGWLKDRYGVSWQIAPRALAEMMRDPDRAKAKRVAEAMLKMVKLDVAALRRAYDGE